MYNNEHGTAYTSTETRPYTIKASPFVWRDPKTFPRREWIYARHLVRRYISCTVAPGGVGKTSLLLVEAVAMATGRNLLNKTVHDGPHRVWMICLEDPLEELERRVLAIMLHYKITPEDLGGRLFLDSGREVKVIVARTTRNGTEIAEPVVGALNSEIRARRIDVLIIDPMVKSHAVQENDNGAIDMVCTAFADIANATNCAVELVHHLRKTNGAEATVEDGRGAVALLGAVRSARVLNAMSKEETDKAGGLNARSFFRDTNGKANLAPPVDKSDWYKLVSVSLCNDPMPTGGFEGVKTITGLIDRSDHVGVVEPWEWPDLTANVTVDHLKQVQIRVMNTRFRENHMAKDWVGHAVANVMGLNIRKKGDKEQVKSALAMWFESGALVKAQGLDDHREMKTFVGVGETG